MNTAMSAQTNQTLVLSGIVELAVGAHAGCLEGLVVNNPNR